MALAASLSIRSPIKIPFPIYNKKKETLSASLASSCKDLKPRNNNEGGKPVQNMVNLRVPSYLSEVENSMPDLFFCILSGSDKRKKYRRCRSKPKTKQIIQMTIPKVFHFSRQEGSGDMFACNYEKNFQSLEKPLTVNLGEDLNDLNVESLGELGEFDHIPSVKPWTQQELDDIKSMYSSLENETPKTTKMKRR